MSSILYYLTLAISIFSIILTIISGHTTDKRNINHHDDLSEKDKKSIN